MDYLTTLSAELGVPIWVFLVMLLWTGIWKLLGLWKSARNGSVVWFVLLALFNTMGILPILYIFIFSRLKCCKPVKKIKSNKKKK